MQQQMFLDVSQAPDRDALQRRLIAFAAALDFGLVNAWLVTEKRSAPAVIDYVGNRSQAFVEASSDPALIQRDPVLHRLHRESLPFTFDRSTYTESGNGDMADMLEAYGYSNGVTVALHLPGNKHFVLSLARGQRLPATDQAVTHLLANLQLVAVHAQIAAQRVLKELAVPRPSINVDERKNLSSRATKQVERIAGGAGRERPIHLTPRELEILQWTMAGKSGTVVAEILGISHAGVKFHLGNAMAKLNAPTKHTAVLKAVSLGLL